MKDKKTTDDNVVFVGTKPFMRYITAVVMQFRKEGNKEVKVVARGKSISRAVDIAEMVKNKILKEEKIIVKKVEIGSEQFDKEEEDGKKKKIDVSTIEITISKER